MKELSKIALAVQPSATLAIDTMFKQMRADGLDVIGFGAGEPDFPTPDHIKEAGIQAIQNNDTKYTPSAGTVELRKAVCQRLKEDCGVDYEPSQISVSSGAKPCVYTALRALVDPGDEVILPAPYWVSYIELIRMVGGVPVVVEASEAEHFKITPEKLAAAITPKTKCMILNNPSNPTGMMYSRSELEAIAKVCVENDLYVISDEIYYHLVYDNEEFVSLAAISPEIKERTLLINGVSKSYAMTGWRIGFVAAPAEIVDRMTKCQENFNACANAPGQYAATVALDHPELCEELRQIFERRRSILLDGLAKIDGIRCNRPNGAFYVFADISSFGLSSVEFCNRLLDEQKVVCIPGSAFGECGEGFIRIAYTCSDDELHEALKRISRFCSELRAA